MREQAKSRKSSIATVLDFYLKAARRPAYPPRRSAIKAERLLPVVQIESQDNSKNGVGAQTVGGRDQKNTLPH